MEGHVKGGSLYHIEAAPFPGNSREFSKKIFLVDLNSIMMQSYLVYPYLGVETIFFEFYCFVLKSKHMTKIRLNTGHLDREGSPGGFEISLP